RAGLAKPAGEELIRPRRPLTTISMFITQNFKNNFSFADLIGLSKGLFTQSKKQETPYLSLLAKPALNLKSLFAKTPPRLALLVPLCGRRWRATRVGGVPQPQP
ncbi:MAG: hypothetical protein PF692_04550, partial [Kiritimatiellae bacterium]|nr:hypothetical protein [Kiritimatiellia bacterium]